MAKLSSDGKYVTVQKGDTLSGIASKYAGGASNYKKLAAINNISNPNLIYVGQKIYLTSSGSSSSGSSSSKSSSTNKPTITAFGEQSDAEGVLFATWKWDKSNTESYKVLWTYDTGNGVWFEGSNATNTVDKDSPSMARQSTYSVPSNARKVRFKVKPISKKKTKNGKETSYWTANWSDTKTWTDSTPLETPPVPSVEIEKYKLTATLDNLDIDAAGIEFEVVKDNASKSFKTGKAKIVSAHVSYSCTVDAGSEYKVRCRAYKGSNYSEWSAYSANEGTIPSAPSGITTIRAASETSVYLEWKAVKSAKTYDLEYTTKKNYFDGSNQTTVESGIESTHYEMGGLGTGEEYFFRVRAVNDDGYSTWCEPKSVKIGDDPAAPTTWSSTTTAIVGEPLKLYWVHNASDGSSQTYAELELTIDNSVQTITIKNDRDEDEKDKTMEWPIDTTDYPEGTKILWRVRTAGVTLNYGDWSIQRTIDIYAPPTLDLTIADIEGDSIDTVTTFPIYIKGVAGPNTQAPIGYHISVVSNELYETVDNIGNPLTVNQGETIYSKHIDVGYSNSPLSHELSAGDIDLENGIEYIVTCVVSMNSGLTVEESLTFTVGWEDLTYEPNAEISVDTDTYTAAIQPYCMDHRYAYYAVSKSGRTYTRKNEEVRSVYGEIVSGAETTDGYQVYYGADADGNDIYYCQVETTSYTEGITLSVYRREFDGSFTVLAEGLDNSKFTTIIDPHPSLDYARYRIVAMSVATGAVSFYDPPGTPVGGNAVIVQWDEAWSSFETTEASALEQPPWSGSILKLPYNIDISDSVSPDVAMIEYIGREHPVTYYGTQLGTSSSWSMVIDKNDKETLYALRRLSRWMGDVYVREPSGSGYWANIVVSFSQKHCDPAVPVSFNVVRVEGGA